jgi:hypothetical protein
VVLNAPNCACHCACHVWVNTHPGPPGLLACLPDEPWNLGHQNPASRDAPPLDMGLLGVVLESVLLLLVLLRVLLAPLSLYCCCLGMYCWQPPPQPPCTAA